MLRWLFARLGYVPVEHVDALERELGDVRASYKHAWGVDVDRMARRYADREREHARVVAFLMERLADRAEVAS